jgi:serine/threonine-protein kinase
MFYRVGSTIDVNTAARRAYEADAFLSNAEVVLQRLFLSSYDLGDFTPRAESYCQQINKRFSRSANAMYCRLLLMTSKAFPPKPDEAWVLADSGVLRLPKPQQPQQRLINNVIVAAILARAELRDSARRVIVKSQAGADIDPGRELGLYSAFAYTLIGDTAQAIGSLKQYLAANEERRAAYRDDPGWWFRPLAGNAEFRQLVGANP